MRKQITIITLSLIIALPALAAAAGFDAASGTADCNGWQADFEIGFRSGATLVRLDYAVVLSDGLGTEIERQEQSLYLDIPASLTAPLSIGEAWSAPMSDEYTAAATFILLDFFPDGRNKYTEEMILALDCSEDTGEDDPVMTDACHYGQGYWKSHETAWPVMELTLGVESYGQEALLEIMNTPTRGDATVSLARHLIAAKLNMANGGDHAIGTTVDDADAWLTDHPVFSKPGKEECSPGLALKEALEAYNEEGCPEGDSTAVDPVRYQGLDTAGMQKAASVENISLGTLKAQYR